MHRRSFREPLHDRFLWAFHCQMFFVSCLFYLLRVSLWSTLDALKLLKFGYSLLLLLIFLFLFGSDTFVQLHQGPLLLSCEIAAEIYLRH